MRDKDRAVARIAAGQHGVVTIEQLLRCGLARAAVSRRVGAGRLHKVHRGVYAVGHLGLTTEGRYLAAVLASGEGAILSHAAAAHVLRLTRGAPPQPEVSSLVERKVRGARLHRPNALHPLDVSVHDGIPITTVPRTLVDLAADLSLGDLARACHEAHVHHRTTPPQIEAAIERAPNRKGMGTLRQALRGDALVLSELEAGFLTLLRKHDLPLPQTNRPAGADRVDCHWPDRDLIVELDSYRFHATRAAWETDVRRTRRAATKHHLRFTWGDVFDRAAQTAAELTPYLTS